MKKQQNKFFYSTIVIIFSFNYLFAFNNDTIYYIGCLKDSNNKLIFLDSTDYYYLDSFYNLEYKFIQSNKTLEIYSYNKKKKEVFKNNDKIKEEDPITIFSFETMPFKDIHSTINDFWYENKDLKDKIQIKNSISNKNEDCKWRTASGLINKNLFAKIFVYKNEVKRSEFDTVLNKLKQDFCVILYLFEKNNSKFLSNIPKSIIIYNSNNNYYFASGYINEYKENYLNHNPKFSYQIIRLSSKEYKDFMKNHNL
jgi:hypothetical protein